MRTRRRNLAPLNTGKQQALDAVLRAFADEKRYWMSQFETKACRPFIKEHRVVRDRAVSEGYTPTCGLQARMWKLALIEAAQTWHKWWEAVFVKVREQIGRRTDFSDIERRYAFWLMCGYDQLFACIEGEAPLPSFSIEAAARVRVSDYVRRKIRSLRGNSPCARAVRSLVLDANCYDVFEKNGHQHLSMMSLVKRQRIVLPLLGHCAISGNIRVVKTDGGIEVHCSSEMQQHVIQGEAVAAIDFGYTEAFTDHEGYHYGEGLGKVISAASDERNDKGKARNRLHALAKRYAASDSEKLRRKARHLKRYNLGTRKWKRRERKIKATIACTINQGLNQVIAVRNPSILVSEHLRHAFTFHRPKEWNRKLSAWAKGVLQDRVEFKALAEGFRHEQVNPAYSSQTCPCCGDVDEKNRHGDQFVCIYCGYEGHADTVAAMNIICRLNDPDITKFTPLREVKRILLERFHRRLEAAQAATVPGRTLDTVAAPPPVQARRKSQRAEALCLDMTRRSLKERNEINGIKRR